MPRKVKCFDVDDLIERHKAGESVNQASKRLGVGRFVVDRFFREAGFITRSLKDANSTRYLHISQEKRRSMTAAAHNSVRGKRQTYEHRVKIAKARELRATPIGTERKMISLLKRRGFACVPQKAIGPYNVDIALTELSIAVEIFGGHWHTGGRHAARFRKRTDEILDAGWAVIIVWVIPKKGCPLTGGSADEILALSKRMRRDKTLRSQEIVISGNGKFPAAGHNKSDGRPIVPDGGGRDDATGQYASFWQ